MGLEFVAFDANRGVRFKKLPGETNQKVKRAFGRHTYMWSDNPTAMHTLVPEPLQPMQSKDLMLKELMMWNWKLQPRLHGSGFGKYIQKNQKELASNLSHWNCLHIHPSRSQTRQTNMPSL